MLVACLRSRSAVNGKAIPEMVVSVVSRLAELPTV
jgi:hypothetical protein